MTTTLPGLDHFQCYEIKPQTFQNVDGVQVEDQFGTLVEQVRFPHRLCAPADKNGEGIVDPTDHLLGHETRAVGFTAQKNKMVTNQFGTLLLDVTRPDVLLVPASKNGVQQLPPLDHFQCYNVKRSTGAPKFVKRTVTVSNQFETATVDVIKPVRLCAPANKNGEDPSAPNHPEHLLCYKTRNGPFPQQVHVVSDQFATQGVRIIHRRELCLPSLKN